MSLTTPILRSVASAFDATQAYDFIFDSVGGDQVVGSNLVIQKYSDSTEVYNSNVDTFQFKHTIGANTLTQNLQYKAKIRTKNISSNWSSFSDWIVFWCFAPAALSIPTIVDGVVSNQTVEFVGNYVQPNDNIQSYRFYLYNYNGQTLAFSPEIFTSDTENIKYTFAGLQNQTLYKIELKTYSVHKVECSTGLIVFMPDYIQPNLIPDIILENIKETGYIKLTANIVQIVGESSNTTYEDDELINIKQPNSIVSFSDNVDILSNDFEFTMIFKDIPEDTVFLKILGTNGNISIKYYNNRFHAFKTTNIVSHFINLSDIIFTSTDLIKLEIKQINGLIDVVAQLIT